MPRCLRKQTHFMSHLRKSPIKERNFVGTRVLNRTFNNVINQFRISFSFPLIICYPLSFFHLETFRNLQKMFEVKSHDKFHIVTFYTIIFSVSTVESKTGDKVTLSWSVPYFPSSGLYNIFHMKHNESTNIIQLSTNNSEMPNKSKYRYLSRPYNSTCISFEILDITLNDAGYYAGGINKEKALSSGHGVVLQVSGGSFLKFLFIHFFSSYLTIFFLFIFFKKRSTCNIFVEKKL